MINIYNPDGSISMQAFVTKEAKREEELSKSDYISLSFNATVKVVLPMGAYIEHTYYIDRTRSVTQKFMLLEPYTPTQVDEMSWKYAVEFHHPKMQLGKKPFYIKTKNSQNEDINQTIWSFVGTPQGMMENVCAFLNNDIKFGKCGWKAILSGAMNNSISVSFSDNDVLSALTEISNASGDECEWHIDYDDEIVYLGKVSIDSAEKFKLSVGENVGVPSVTESSDGYYNAFAVFGGTRNITQVNNKNENVSSSDIRLQLAKGDGLMVIDGSPVQFSVDQFSVMDLRTDKTLPKFTKVLNFPDIYPSLDTYVYDVRGRKKYVLDPQTNKPIVLRKDEQGNVLEYKTFTVWFMRLAYCTKNKEADKQAVNSTVKDGVTYYWYDFVITDDLKINGKNLSCSFEPNFEEGALSTPLAGRGTNGDYVGFELTYHTKSKTSHDYDDCSTGNFNIKQGDYEIIHQEDNNIIIPTNEEQLIIPKGKALPTFECNKVVLYNIAMADVYKVPAQKKLLEAAKKDIILALADTNNYTVKSYPHVFKAQKPRLQIGQSVSLSGKGLRLDTRVLKLSTNLDFDYIQEITVGNKVIKGAVSQLKEDVQSIIANGGGSGSGGGYSVAQFESLVSKYGIKHFLSKEFADVAQEIISFAKGLKLGKEAADNPLGISSDGIATLREIVSAAFRSGTLGSGFRLGDYNGSGDSYLEVDRLLVRKAAEFVRLVIRELQSVGGEIVLSPAVLKISNVVYFEKGVYLPEYEALPLRYNVYRCYFSQKKGDEEIENQFVEGDLVRCQTFNVKEGVSENVKNRYYWRKVYKVGKDFIDVLADFCDTGSDIPQAGDELVQMGNTTDTARQSVVVLSAYGADAPSLKMYEGVNSYSLDNREVFVLSRSEMFAIADKFKFITRKANGEIESTQSFAELVISVDGLKSTVATNKSDITQMRSDIKQMPNQILLNVGKYYPTKTDVTKQIESASSEITQTATNIAMKVGYTLAERRNLLVGSLFRKQGEGFLLLRSKIYRTSAHEGANVIFAPDAKAGGAQWGGAANSRNIHVTKGKTYTLAFWARTKSAKVEIIGEAIWHSSANDTSRPGGYTGPNGSANLGAVTITPSNGWHLYQKTFTVAADALYEWISVACLKANASTASQQVYIAHPILIEGTAEDFVCWSASPDDYDYIGGNLLDNTRTFNKTGNLTRMDASVVTNESYNNGCSVIYANAASKYIEMAQWSVSSIIKKDEDYMFSFMAKGSGSIDAYMWSGSNLSIFAEDSERDTTTSNADGGRRFSLTSEWKRYWVHWRSDGTGIPNYVLIRCLQGGKAWVTMPKLEVGATPTDWIEGKSGFIEDSGIAAKLLRTGLDIENGKITATADKFEVRNNSGVVTASVNDNGLLEVNAGLFSGFVRKKLTVITPENIGQYTIPSAQLGYVVFDFAAAGSFVSFEGDFRAVYGSDYPTIILPYTNYSSSTRPNSVPFAQAVPYLDQKFIVINKANTSVVIVGGGTINKRGSTTIGTSNLPNEVGTNQSAIVTCTLKTTTKSSGNSCTIVWDGYVYG
nr:MAG TPA: tail protein [Caudoviricetes sp.]